jgi:hypothetical protein
MQLRGVPEAATDRGRSLTIEQLLQLTLAE